MGQAPKEAERTVATKIRLLLQLKDRVKIVDPFGKKDYGSSGELPGKLRPYKSGH